MHNKRHRQEVQAFVVACEQLYRLLSEGDSLSVGETETVMCCLDELRAQGRSARKRASYTLEYRKRRWG